LHSKDALHCLYPRNGNGLAWAEVSRNVNTRKRDRKYQSELAGMFGGSSRAPWLGLLKAPDG